MDEEAEDNSDYYQESEDENSYEEEEEEEHYPDSSEYESYDSGTEESESTEESEDDNSDSAADWNSDGIDRISALPNEILCQILSLLEMDKVMQTSVLSKRWRYVWKSVSCLNFNYYTMKKKLGFKKLVDIMSLTDGIQKLKIKGCYDFSADETDGLIMAAVKRHVEELHLDIHSNYKDRLLPDIIFTSKVSVLSLKSSCVTPPTSMCLASSLKTLKLKSTTLPEGDSNGDLVLSCPILENLTLVDCNHRNFKNLDISAHQLKNLVIDNQSYSDGSADSKIRISTPNLISLVLKGIFYKDYSLQNLKCLVTAKLDAPDEKVRAHPLRNIIEGLSNATTIELSYKSLQFRTSKDIMNDQLSFFSNLRRLKLAARSKDPRNPCLLNLLKGSPYVETLSLGMNQLVEMEEDWGELFTCISHLKSVEIHSIKGVKNALRFSEFLLKNALILEEFTAVTIEIEPSLEEKMVKFGKRLHSLPRASSRVNMIFILRTVKEASDHDGHSW